MQNVRFPCLSTLKKVVNVSDFAGIPRKRNNLKSNESIFGTVRKKQITYSEGSDLSSSSYRTNSSKNKLKHKKLIRVNKQPEYQNFILH